MFRKRMWAPQGGPAADGRPEFAKVQAFSMVVHARLHIGITHNSHTEGTRSRDASSHADSIRRQVAQLMVPLVLCIHPARRRQVAEADCPGVRSSVQHQGTRRCRRLPRPRSGRAGRSPHDSAATKGGPSAGEDCYIWALQDREAWLQAGTRQPKYVKVKLVECGEAG